MITRREVLIMLGAGTLALPLASSAQQQNKVWRIGYLTNRLAVDSNKRAFIQAMRELGYVEDKNLVIEWRSADDKIERHPGLAAELVKMKVDVIVTTASQPTAAAQRATASIPIVMVGVGDPVSSGFVKSLARPGGNITGLSSLTQDLGQKQLEMLASVRPKPARIAVLVDPGNKAHAAILKNVQAVAPGAGINILAVEARTGAEIAQAISIASRENARAIIVPGGLFNGHLLQIIELAVKDRLASISAFHNFSENGGLMSYGQNLADQYRRAATYVDKIFKGMKPGDLPIEQPSKFELAINLKTAKAIGLTIPQELLLRADKVIE